MKTSFSLLYKPILVGSILLLAGCKKFLVETNPSNISMDSYYTRPEHAESAINAIYEDTRPVYDGGGLSGAAWLMLEFPTGLTNSVTLGAAGPTNSSIRMLDMNADNAYLNFFWNSYYRGIANANVAIQKIPGITMDEVRKKKLLGEAHFLRAYYYFNLVRIFGKIPIILEPLDKSSEQLFPEQSSVDAAYKIIVEDLQFAENAGLPFTDATGRISLGATKSLLASVYLTMAGYPLQAGTEYYQKARDKAQEVMSSGKYGLFDSYEKLRTVEAKNQGENIFMVQYDPNIVSHYAFQELFTPYNINITAFGTETGMIYPVSEFLGAYDAGDKRKREKEFYYRKYTLATDRNTVIDLGGWYIYKWFDVKAITETGTSGLNWPILRYAEVLFIFAEAENEVSGPSDNAYKAINAIRARAEIDALKGLSKEQFREAVWKEKWLELCYENKTWFDMVRLKKTLNLVTGKFVDLVGSRAVYGPTYTEKNLLFPIPTSEILNNKKLIQNKGY